MVRSPSMPRGMEYFYQKDPKKFVEHMMEVMSCAPKEVREKQVAEILADPKRMKMIELLTKIFIAPDLYDDVKEAWNADLDHN